MDAALGVRRLLPLDTLTVGAKDRADEIDAEIELEDTAWPRRTLRASHHAWHPTVDGLTRTLSSTIDLCHRPPAAAARRRLGDFVACSTEDWILGRTPPALLPRLCWRMPTSSIRSSPSRPRTTRSSTTPAPATMSPLRRRPTQACSGGSTDFWTDAVRAPRCFASVAGVGARGGVPDDGALIQVSAGRGTRDSRRAIGDRVTTPNGPGIEPRPTYSSWEPQTSGGRFMLRPSLRALSIAAVAGVPPRSPARRGGHPGRLVPRSRQGGGDVHSHRQHQQ